MTKTFKVAHIREQGVNLIIAPMDRSFDFKTAEEQGQFAKALEFFAHDAGLAGTVVPVWESGGGRMSFIAPPGYHPYFKSISLGFVYHNVNKSITCHL